MSANIKASTDGTQAIIGVGGVDQMTVSNAGVVTANSFVGAMNGSSVTATGSTAPRTLANRFADVVNVKNFLCADGLPVAGDGIHDDTTGIQAALNSIPFNFSATGKTGVYFPRGKYKITDTIQVKSNYTGLFCDAQESAEITQTNFSVAESILVKSTFTGNGIFGFSIQNLALVRGASSTFQKGLVLESCNNTHITDAIIAGFPTCMEIRGGVNCHYTALRLSDFGSTNTNPNVGLLEINASTYVSNPIFFTHLFSNSMIAGSRYCVKITSGDYITFSNCYLGGGLQGDVLIEGGSIYANYNNRFDNCYFDSTPGGPTDLTRAAIEIKPGSLNEISITNCRFGPWGVGLRIDNSYYPDVLITGTTFLRCNTAIQMSAIATATSLTLTGNKFKGCGMITGNSTIIDIKNIRQTTITGNDFGSNYADWVAYGSLGGTKKIISIATGATIENISITGNVLDGFTFGGVTFVDFENLGTVNQLAIAGNASNNPNNTLVGHVIGNQLSSNPLMLDWYQEGTFAPLVAFGGSSVGVAYATRVANYTRIGNRMMFDIYIQLSSKGGLTGDMTISGFPYPLSPSGTSTGNLSISLQGVDLIGSSNIDGLFNTTTTAIARYINSSGNAVNISDANMRDNSLIFLSGVVQVA